MASATTNLPGDLGFSLAFPVCALAALAAALRTSFGLHGERENRPAEEVSIDPLHPNPTEPAK